MLVLLSLLISRLINRSGLRISHSKVFSSGDILEIQNISVLLNISSLREEKKFKIKIEIDLKETKSAKMFKQRVIKIYLENYERFKVEKPSFISCE